ncbi:fimbrial protein [Siccibacter colletis]|uniref:Type 1 fimbrial protein n=1 Tax=Siccibacter colletis TaxID=1505757 RepID=A0ABY6JDG2_9ENTR|nr:fimbrial protein [Siccibacter colletis]UYU30498.1 type 1 fimbrial protein [Siccibacter colletis]
MFCNKLSGLTGALLIMLASETTFADPVTINITGNIVASPCTVNGGNNALSVSLGDIQASSLQTAGATSPAKDFSIDLTDCPTGTTNVKVVFSGTEDTEGGSSYYKNSGTAKNVAVALIDKSTGSKLGNGESIEQEVTADKTVTFELQTQAYSVSGGALPGTIQAAITADLTYQ